MVWRSQSPRLRFVSFMVWSGWAQKRGELGNAALPLSHVCTATAHGTCLFPDDEGRTYAAVRARRVDHSGFSSAACQFIPITGTGLSDEGVFPFENSLS